MRSMTGLGPRGALSSGTAQTKLLHLARQLTQYRHLFYLSHAPADCIGGGEPKTQIISQQ